jgi:hypothetical protein
MPLGSYWGGAGEQIDNLSGNLNFSLPILTAKSAGGWNVGFRLSYNSQNWRHDSAGDWLIGWAGPGAPALDVGFGFGWKLLAGAVSPGVSSDLCKRQFFPCAAGGSGRWKSGNPAFGFPLFHGSQCFWGLVLIS